MRSIAWPVERNGMKFMMNRMLGFSMTLLWACSAEPEVAAPEKSPSDVESIGRARLAQTSEDVVVRDLLVTTQGPLWPPSELADADGNFVLLGVALTKTANGMVVEVGSNAAIVSKDTVPPLGADGRERTTFDWLGAEYSIVRELDLAPNSPDRGLVLHSLSFGPARGAFGGGPRIPMAGRSAYNLNGSNDSCPELFPTDAQAREYVRQSRPLHDVPVSGFEGDGVAHHVSTGQSFDPMTATGEGCPFRGCAGEDPISTRRQGPITLDEWLDARGQVRVELASFDEEQEAFTHANFEFTFRNLLPDALYSVWGVRARNRPSQQQALRPLAPLGVPNVFRTDSSGAAAVAFNVRNPFPSSDEDVTGQRLVGLRIVFHSDMQSWGACLGRLGAGVDVHSHLSTFVDGTQDFTSLVTVEP
jgi:hypothetical protein